MKNRKFGKNQTTRITSGELGGREIMTPGGGTHPMGSRERLALANALGDVRGARVLDAFAGSGAIGFELLSRGAEFVVFVDVAPEAAKIIRENAERLGVYDKCEVLVTDVSRLDLGETFDLVVADPPYDDFAPEKIASLTGLLRTGGTLVLSHPTEQAPSLPGLSLQKARKYARARISFYNTGPGSKH